MDYYIEVLKNSTLFHDMREEEITSMMRCLSARTVHYRKGQLIFRAGDTTPDLGVVLKGTVTLVKEDYWGNRSILDKNEAGKVFGEVYACLGNEPLLVSAAADADTVILFLDIRRVVNICSSACLFHNRLIQNLLKELAGKALLLTRKIQHISKRTTREKLLSYLSEAAFHAGSRSFHIPFNRQELADYLSVDRSAMSAELGRMKKEGIIDFNRNYFSLLTPPADEAFYF